MSVTYHWRGTFDNTDIGRLHAEGFADSVPDADWWTRLNRHSLGWVCARQDGRLVGFVNVAWDGGRHAFLLDTLVTERLRRRGVGVRLVAAAVSGARAAGCEWIHVDFTDQLRGFYLGACGFRPTSAGLTALRSDAGLPRDASRRMGAP